MPDLPAPPLSEGITDWWSRAGLFGVYVFASFALLGITPATLGLVLSVLAFLLRFNAWGRLIRDPVAMLACAFGVYVTLHSLAFYLLAATPDEAATVLDHGSDWLKLLLFVPLAYWIGGRHERLRRVLLLALLGFTLGTFRKIDWATFGADFFTTRFDAYLPSIAFGMFAGLGALGLLATRRAFWGAAERGPWFGARVALWAVWLLIMLEGLLLSQSRGSWLGFVAGTGILLLLEWRTQPGSAASGDHPRRRLALLLVAGTLAGVLMSQWETIGVRLSDQTETLRQVIQGDVSEVAADPVGLRVNALQFAYEKWLERPWLGWGAGSSRELITTSGRPEALLDNVNWLPHLHNSYAETAVQLGAVGLALAFALLWALVRSSRRECRTGRLPADMCALFAVSLGCVLVWNLFNYRVVRSDWMFFWILFAGGAYSFRLAWLIAPPGRGDA